MSEIDSTGTESGTSQPNSPSIVVVGIGADGWDGLSGRARRALQSATTIIGSRRQLDLLADVPATRVAWRSPMSAHLAEVIGSARSDAVPADPAQGATRSGSGDTPIHILASGDPMFHGIGTSLIRELGAEHVTIIPAVSSAALACAALGWDAAHTPVVSTVTAPVSVIVGALSRGNRFLILSRDGTTPAQIADLMTAQGFGDSSMTVLEQLGGPAERRHSARAVAWDEPLVDPLNIVAVDCVGPRRTPLPGRPEDAYAHDGQITKSTVRALTVCALEPAGAQVLWDIGSGSGSVAVEWLRADADGRAVAFEVRTDRAVHIPDNADRFGVGDRITVLGGFPQALTDSTPQPDAVFIGGGLDTPMLERVWAALGVGGRLVINAVTIENQTLLTTWAARHGGILRRIGVETAAPLGGFTTWRPALPIVQWTVDKYPDGGEPTWPST
ncbi:bifunctional cobalt-precorrin-7 (C(5))-methyltransferase/cobalt-precorrin-6B (C(15))-methyltransferase [Gordonia desulfuricans]|uniref:Bifunctional cobalt-precorrin-7 (C(5))-methyltransferase/cobalt-precorrin-6B (C(15))-methyltransferase n=1 Tax=Gordonia desulfuricans TaxID=89051 RepID=A0A7K3LSK7_9ACTN|nr:MULTISPECIES: bifunctional cobalt-precorrin-7 (C(5))-methyltransferase/cobalt-precorrin-6B (C(15))-methyltransferase [Gordonia]NDK91192.1 bifunctional cobalt-precorrin-7 (C(5))-methyltransferase/cobalt-precorrin-6B (C(15))-methyltransferase [Gordonia desulfuricans]WLP90864.1 bifunctional cobalt-precorrin-7 (C(5))-methyltransferase/cobalt-precorrin-6B (C(15))-methyltransferase [Gordonia sp. NB41Y]